MGNIPGVSEKSDEFKSCIPISGCIGDRVWNGVPSESLSKDILFECESTARGHCTGEREGIFVMSSFTGTREDQYSDEAHFHLDCKVNSQNLRLWSLGKPDVIAEVLFYLVKNKIWCMGKSQALLLRI